MNGKMAVIPVSMIAIIAFVISMAAVASPEPTGNPENFTVHLLAGWNLVSFLEENSPDNMFAGMTYTMRYWDAPYGPYKAPFPDQPVEDNLGYWVLLDNDKTITASYPPGPEGPAGPRGYGMATFVVAAYNSLDNENADFVCDGTDDQVEINAAINDLPASGGSIYLREGTYVVSGSITIDKSNVTLVGAGASTVIKIRDSHDTNIHVIDASGKSGLLIQNLRIDGNKANQTAGDMRGIQFTNVENSKIVDCWVEDLRGRGIYLISSSNNNTITGNTCQGNNKFDIVLESSSNNTVTGNTCQGGASDGIVLANSSNNTVTGNTCQGNSNNGIYLYLSSNNTVTGNTCQGNGSVGISIQDSDNNTVTGNTCHGNEYNGIGLYSSSNNNTVSGNICQGNGRHGIYLYSSSNNTVTGNTVVSNSQTADNTYDGINIDFNSDYNNIQGNTVRRGTGGNQQRYGIFVDDANCDNNLVITNDLYQAGVTADYSDAGTGTIYHNNRTTAGWVP